MYWWWRHAVDSRQCRMWAHPDRSLVQDGLAVVRCKTQRTYLLTNAFKDDAALAAMLKLPWDQVSPRHPAHPTSLHWRDSDGAHSPTST